MLISLKFSNEKEILEIATHRYSMDVLTVIPVIWIKKGILFVKDNLKDTLNEGNDKEKWIIFGLIF